MGVALVVALALLSGELSLREGLATVEGWVERTGAWGPVAFGIAYVAAALLLVPGSALAFTAGALFGLLEGTVVVSLASTAAAAAAFLVARGVARERVQRLVATRPRLRALDQAVSEGGWRVVGLLRLSPVVPFSVSNYLFGFTGVRFTPYVLATWIGFLPMTLLEVYLGVVGRAGLEAAAGAGRDRGPGEWAFLGVGAVATVAVAVLLMWLARRKLEEQAREARRAERVRARAEPGGRPDQTSSAAPGRGLVRQGSEVAQYPG